MKENESHELTEKKITILDAAERLMAEHGYEATSVREVAKAAGVNVAMISYYFGSKEKMMEALVAHRISSVKMSLESVANDKELQPLEKMYRLAELYVNRVLDNQNFHQIMSREEWIHKQSQTSKIILDAKKQNHDIIKKLFNEGLRQGVFRKNVDIPMLLVTLTGTINQVMTRQAFMRKMYQMDDESDEQYQKFIKRKLSNHLKNLFKALLTHEN